ncbi:hypothetical protein [Prescottella subtropica]|uniref:hypothetical protein n=1 Tax=Prescottella subtropica TaxID=2545757 RepID=UPI001386F35E|nr:hypothetical protein [Prescottella subtropica]
MGKITETVSHLLKRRKGRLPDPASKQLDRWADEGGALPPSDPRDDKGDAK